MKNKILKLNKSLDDAVIQAMMAIEIGQFHKVINLLEYVRHNKEYYDEVMVEYALLVSYVNTGNYVKATETIETLDGIYIENEQIKEVIQNIKNEVIENKAKNKTYDKKQSFNIDVALKELSLERKQIELYRDLHVDDYMWSLILAAVDNLGNSRIEFEHEYKQTKKEYFDTFTQLIEFDQFSDNQAPLDLFSSKDTNDGNVLFWLLVTKKNITEVLNNEHLPNLIKNYFLERAVHYCHYGLVPDFEINYISNVINLGDLPDFPNDFYEVANNIESYYEIENPELYDMIASVLKILYVNAYPNDVYENKHRLEAIVGYIVNDIFLGRQYDGVIEHQTGYNFDEVKKEMQELEMLITFLIS